MDEQDGVSERPQMEELFSKLNDKMNELQAEVRQIRERADDHSSAKLKESRRPPVNSSDESDYPKASQNKKRARIETESSDDDDVIETTKRQKMKSVVGLMRVNRESARSSGPCDREAGGSRDEVNEVMPSDRDRDDYDEFNKLFEENEEDELEDEAFLNSLSHFQENERGPAVKQQLADVANAMAYKKLDEEVLKRMKDKYKVPENVQKACVPSVNTEIWANLPAAARSADIKLQKVQHVLLKAQAATLRAADEMVDVWKKCGPTLRKNLPGDPINETIKENVASLTDVVKMIEHASTEVSYRRREHIVTNLSPRYQRLASEKVELSDQLFGYELRDAMSTIDRSSKLSANLRGAMNARGRASFLSRGRGRAGRGFGFKRGGYSYNQQRGYPYGQRGRGRRPQN